MPDFSLAQIPNFAASALGGFQAGQAMGRQNQVQSALSGIDLSRPETLTPLLKVDPEHGIALLGASSAMLKNERDIAARQATTDYLTARFAPKPSTTGVSTDGTSVSTAAPVASLTAPGTLAAAPTAPASPDLSSAEHALMSADPQGYLKLRESADAMDAASRAKLVESQTALHEAAVAASQLPYEQRRAYLASRTQELAAHYVTPEQIAGFDPTDQNLAIAQNEALGVKGVADRADKAAALKLARDKEAREARQGDARIGIAAGALKVAKDRAAKVGTGAGDVSGDDTAALLAAAGL